MIPRSAITHWNKQVPWEDIANMEEKMSDPEFTGDTTKLLRSEINFNPDASWNLVRETLVEKLIN